MNRAKRNRIMMAITAVLLLTVFTYLAITLPSQDYGLIDNRKIDLNHGWTVEYDDTILHDVSFPRDLNLDELTIYTASLILPEDLEDHIRLRIRSSMQDLIVYVDGSEIFRDVKDTNGSFEVPDASLWHMIELPNDSGGKELRIQMQSPTKAFSGMLNEVYAGQGKDLVFDIISSNIFKLTLSGIFIIFGLITLAVSVVVNNLEDNRLIYLGILAVFVAFWIFSESKVMQLVVGNRFIIGGLSYMIIPLIAILFILFLKESVLRKYTSIMDFLAIMFLVNLVINLYFQLAGISSFIGTMEITVVLIVITLVCSLFFMVLEWKKHENQQARDMLIYSSVSSVFLLVEIMVFLLGRYEMTGYFTAVGVLFFFIQISYNTFRSVNKMIQKDRESEILKKLAYMDILTNMGNRAAFEEYIDRLRDCESCKPFRLTMMDINNLKNINDDFGHKVGDEAIKACSSAIEKHLMPYGDCFRLGGDEFACIIFDLEEEDYLDQVDKLRKDLNATKPEHEYKLDIAIGSDIFDYSEHNDIGDFIHETDLKMYSNKKSIKKRGYGTL